MKLVLGAAIFSAIFKFCQTGVRLWAETIEGAQYMLGPSTIAYFGSSLSPALIAVGYIVGLNIAVLVFVGGTLNWLVAIPILTAAQGGGPAGQTALEHAGNLWSTQTRYLGVGAMVIGGLWALVQMRSSVFSGVRSGLAAYKRMREGGEEKRTERDMPMQWVLVAIIASIIPLFFLDHFLMGSIGISLGMAISRRSPDT